VAQFSLPTRIFAGMREGGRGGAYGAEDEVHERSIIGNEGSEGAFADSEIHDEC
jgi:hypothetical protein